ncbi:reverse transcriptase domain-containing protein [Tanacetum coccineum]
MEEVSLTIDEAKLKKMVDEMFRQRYPEAPALSLINQDLLYLKKGSSGPEKIVLSLHKFLAIIFNDDDIEERTSRWVNKCVNKFNPYARYGVEHWKNPHAKIIYIKKQKEPGKPKEEVYSNSKIIQVIKTYWELGHEHKFITEIVTRRANKCIMSITEPDYKNLNKNDIEDMYLLIMNGKVPDYAETGLLWSLSVFVRSLVIWGRVHNFQLRIESYQQKVNLTAPTISFPGVEKHKMFSIIYEPVHGIIYKNSKKEKRVMRHLEIHKFYDATLNRELEGLKGYNNDVKYGYVQRELTNDEVEYLKLFEEEIEINKTYHKLPEPVWCRFFPITLCGAARFWYENLAPGSIDGFHQLRDKFRANFLQQRRFQKTQAEILGIRQRPNESLKDYVARFSKETLHMVDRSDAMVSGAFISGLRPGRLFKDLIARPLTSLEDLFTQTHNFIRSKDANKENHLREPRQGNRETKQHATYKDLLRRPKDKFVSRAATRYNEHHKAPHNPFTALIKLPAEIFATTEGMSILRPPPKMFTPANKRDRTKYCEFHEDHGHDINDCIDLWKDIETCVRNRRLSHLVKGTKTQNNSQASVPSGSRNANKPQIE